MKKTPLKDYLEPKGRTQSALAEAVGLAQTAISKMLRSGRNILVVEHDDGQIELLEERRIRPGRT